MVLGQSIFYRINVLVFSSYTLKKSRGRIKELCLNLSVKNIAPTELSHIATQTGWRQNQQNFHENSIFFFFHLLNSFFCILNLFLKNFEKTWNICLWEKGKIVFQNFVGDVINARTVFFATLFLSSVIFRRYYWKRVALN